MASFTAPDGVTQITVLGSNYTVSAGVFTVTNATQIARLLADGFVLAGDSQGTSTIEPTKGKLYTPKGTANGTNKTFTLPFKPNAYQVQVYVNGMIQMPGPDYTLTSSQILFATAPSAGATVLCQAF